MRVLRGGLAAAFGVAMMGHAMPAGDPMPPDTVRLSEMMQTLSAQPGFTEAFLKQVQGGAKKAGAALLTPELIHHMRELILGKDWGGLDRFPGWTMSAINPTVRVVGHVAGKDVKVEEISTAGGAPSAAGEASRKTVEAYMDLGDFKLGEPGSVDLDQAAAGPPFIPGDYLTQLGNGVTRGDGPKPDLAPLHAESTRLADALNRLSLNGLGSEAAQPFTASFAGKTVSTPQDLIAALIASGHKVTVADARYFANFGHLHWKPAGAGSTEQDVMMPFWINSQIVVPEPAGGRPRPLLVPVSHAEYEWFIEPSAGTHGPHVKAAVAFYFGIDGKAEFRTMDQLDQAWVMNRHAHEYRGADAVEVTRLTAAFINTYAHLHAAHPAIPFGGYYGFGVCQDSVAAIEMKMTGKATLFPNTADARFFTDPRDEEVNQLIRRLPKDRDGRPPEVERIFGSLPVGTSDAELRSVSIPGLGDDLVAVHKAWVEGTLERVGERRRLRNWLYGLGLVLVVALVWKIQRRRAQERR